jgi:hypothetical protein
VSGIDKESQVKSHCFHGDFRHLRLLMLVTACQALSAKKFIRDVGVEGSNPFTPTIIFPRVFSHVDTGNAATVSAENHSRCQSR